MGVHPGHVESTCLPSKVVAIEGPSTTKRTGNPPTNQVLHTTSPTRDRTNHSIRRRIRRQIMDWTTGVFQASQGQIPYPVIVSTRGKKCSGNWPIGGACLGCLTRQTRNLPRTLQSPQSISPNRQVFSHLHARFHYGSVRRKTRSVPAIIESAAASIATRLYPDDRLSTTCRRSRRRDGKQRYCNNSSQPVVLVEDTGTLQTSIADIEVRVSNIVRLETDEDELASTFPPSASSYAIGTRRGEIDARTGRDPEVQQMHLAVPSENRRNRYVGGLIVSVLVVTLLGFAALAWQYHARQADPVGSQTGTVPPHDMSSIVPENGQQTDAPVPTSEVSRLRGIEPFLRPEVAEKLGLTPSQKGAIDRLDRTTQLALEDLGKYWESPGRLELAQRQAVLLEAAHQQALQILTDQQRRQWEAMTRP